MRARRIIRRARFRYHALMASTLPPLDLAAIPSWPVVTLGELRGAMRNSTGFLITAVIVAGIVVLGVLSIIGWLLYAQRDATIIVSLINTAMQVFLWREVSNIKATTNTVAQQTNGTTKMLIDKVTGGT